MGSWINEDWLEEFRELIYWYVNSNHSSRRIDAAITRLRLYRHGLDGNFVSLEKPTRKKSL